MTTKHTIYKNKKTGNYYVVLGTAINATNAQDGQVMVRYRDANATEGDSEYVREQEEFMVKFEPRPEMTP